MFRGAMAADAVFPADVAGVKASYPPIFDCRNGKPVVKVNVRNWNGFCFLFR